MVSIKWYTPWVFQIPVLSKYMQLYELCLSIISAYNIDFLLAFILLTIVNAANGEPANGGPMKAAGAFNIVTKPKPAVSWSNPR